MNNTVLKIEAFSGASGDMFLGALTEIADAYKDIVQLPDKLGLKNAEIQVNNVVKTGIACKHIKVVDRSEHSHHHHKQGHKYHSHKHDHKHRHLPDFVKTAY